MTTPGPTVVNDIADLYRILDEQPQWKEALRYQLLGPELMAGPERLDELTAGIRELRQTVSQLAETAAANTRQCVELRETTTAQTRQFVELRQTVSQLAETAAENTRQIAELRETAADHTRQLAEQTRQFVELRETVTQLRETAADHTRQIVELRETAADHTRQLAEQTHQFVELRETVSQLRETAADHTRQLAEQTRQFVELRETVSKLRETAADHTRQLAEQTRQFVELRETVSQLRETAADHTRQFVELRQTVSQLAETAADNTRQIVELRRITTNQTTRMNRMENDMSGVKGMKFEYRIERTCVIVANALNLANPEMIPTAELLRFANQLGLEASTKDSFIQADLVFLGQDQEEAQRYAAVEISWTVGQWDIDRARRNAALIEQATGIPALAGAAGTRCEEQLDWSEVAWVRLIA